MGKEVNKQSDHKIELIQEQSKREVRALSIPLKIAKNLYRDMIKNAGFKTDLATTKSVAKAQLIEFADKYINTLNKETKETGKVISQKREKDLKKIKMDVWLGKVKPKDIHKEVNNRVNSQEKKTIKNIVEPQKIFTKDINSLIEKATIKSKENQAIISAEIGKNKNQHEPSR